MVNSGRIEEVARYCESDVLNTYNVWLIHELFRGGITAEQLEWSQAHARDMGSRSQIDPGALEQQWATARV